MDKVVNKYFKVMILTCYSMLIYIGGGKSTGFDPSITRVADIIL